MTRLWKQTQSAGIFQPYFRASERGQSLVEYAKTLTMVSIVVLVSLSVVGLGLREVYCQVLRGFDSSTNDELCTSAGEQAPDVLKSKYDWGKKELDLVAKAHEDCSEDLMVQEYGEPMIRAGSSYVFKKTIPTDMPPASVHIGTDQCGWTEAIVE